MSSIRDSSRIINSSLRHFTPARRIRRLEEFQSPIDGSKTSIRLNSKRDCAGHPSFHHRRSRLSHTPISLKRSLSKHWTPWHRYAHVFDDLQRNSPDGCPTKPLKPNVSVEGSRSDGAHQSQTLIVSLTVEHVEGPTNSSTNQEKIISVRSCHHRKIAGNGGRSQNGCYILLAPLRIVLWMNCSNCVINLPNFSLTKLSH